MSDHGALAAAAARIAALEAELTAANEARDQATIALAAAQKAQSAAEAKNSDLQNQLDGEKTAHQQLKAQWAEDHAEAEPGITRGAKSFVTTDDRQVHSSLHAARMHLIQTRLGISAEAADKLIAQSEPITAIITRIKAPTGGGT